MRIAYISQKSYLEYDGWININLLHALDITQPDRFTPRGNVTISSINTGSFTSSQEPLKSAERTQLQALANANQFYRLKAIVTSQDGERQTFLTYSKAVSVVCVLYKSLLLFVIYFSVLWLVPS